MYPEETISSNGFSSNSEIKKLPKSNGGEKILEENVHSKSNGDVVNHEKKKNTVWGFSFTWEDIKWKYVIGFTIFHIISAYSFLTFPYLERKLTFLWGKYQLKNIINNNYM